MLKCDELCKTSEFIGFGIWGSRIYATTLICE